jgi:hypothetical protein
MIEGYRLQEKNKRVRLALDWALYRVGKSEALFQIVSELNSSRHDQAVGYLAQLDSPDPLYLFLKQETNQPKITAGLLEALGRVGDAQSLEIIKPFRDSFSPGVASTSTKAVREVTFRLEAPQASSDVAFDRLTTAEKSFEDLLDTIVDDLSSDEQARAHDEVFAGFEEK